MGKFLDGLKAAAPVIGSGMDAIFGYLGNRFNAREAEKNRNFQREMYQQQMQDSIKLWNMANQYDLPSAQVQRLRDANLNPLLMYSNGASGVTAANTLSAPNAPSGSQAQGSFNTQFGQAAQQAMLLNAQIANVEADTESKKADVENKGAATANLQQDLLQKRLESLLNVSYKEHMIHNISAATNKLVAETLNTNEMTFQTALTMRQARLYEIKRYNLDASYRGELLQQGWQNIENDTQRVNQGWRNLAIQWRLMQNTINWTNAQIGALQWSVLQDKAMFGERFRGLQLDNKLKIWDTHLRKLDMSEKQINMFNSALKNYYLQHYGNENVPYRTTIPSQPMFQLGTKTPEFQDLLLMPPMFNK